MGHEYPKDLVRALIRLWNEKPCQYAADELPDSDVLEELISTCYQVSMMQEETRSLRFRVMHRDPSRLPPDEGPPLGLLRLIFSEARPFNEYELSKLAPSTDFYNSLIGVSLASDGGLRAWGLIHSGTRWIQSMYGGSQQITPLPPSLVIHVTGPGRISVCRGSVILAELNGGRIIEPALNVFRARWLHDRFLHTRARLLAYHSAARSRSQEPWARLDEEFVDIVYQQVIKRVISIVRRSTHGGTILSFPAEMNREIISPNPYISIKYQFREEESRRRLFTLMVEIMNELAKICWRPNEPDRSAGWKEYKTLRAERLAHLDEAMYEYALFVANLSAIDGAVALAEGPELIGYGAIIQGALDTGTHVAHALDPEAETVELESIEAVGTRHRSAYHLCSRVHDVLATVVSQDGNVRIVTWTKGMVTYWEVIPITLAGLDSFEQ